MATAETAQGTELAGLVEPFARLVHYPTPEGQSCLLTVDNLSDMQEYYGAKDHIDFHSTHSTSHLLTPFSLALGIHPASNKMPPTAHNLLTTFGVYAAEPAPVVPQYKERAAEKRASDILTRAIIAAYVNPHDTYVGRGRMTAAIDISREQHLLSRRQLSLIGKIARLGHRV